MVEKYWSHCNALGQSVVHCTECGTLCSCVCVCVCPRRNCSCHCLRCLPLIAWWPCWKCSLKVLQKLKHFTIVFTGRLTRLSFRFDALFISCCYLSTSAEQSLSSITPPPLYQSWRGNYVERAAIWGKLGSALSRGRLDAVAERSSISFFLFKRSRFSWEIDKKKLKLKMEIALILGKAYGESVKRECFLDIYIMYTYWNN